MRARTTGHARLAIVVVAVGVLGLSAAADAAPKTDVVVLENGDRITCEVKGLSRGRLSAGTDGFDTVNVFWDRVQHVTSTQIFEVETTDGLLYYGQLTSPTPRRLTVDVDELEMRDVIRLTPLDARFWQRIDGNIDLGFSLTRANKEVRFTVNSDAEYHGRRYAGSATLASQFTDRDDGDQVERNSLAAYGARILRNRWIGIVVGQVQTNEELSLNLRSVGGFGAGRYMIQSNAANLMLYGAVVYTNEHYADTDPQNSAEAVAGFRWDWFNARNSDYDLTTQLITFYGLSGDARVRSEFQTALRVKIFSDFTFSVNGYDSFDSSPPQDEVKNDYGVSLSLGWKF